VISTPARARCAAPALLAALLFFAGAARAGAQPLRLDLPVLDSSVNLGAEAAFPSMAQSLALTRSFYQLGHTAVQRRFAGRSRSGVLALAAFDALANWLPLGSTWLHEEWHRAVLSQYGIGSRNDVYDLDLFAESVSVSGVTDADLEWLKREHPADLVRLRAAGFEAETELQNALEAERFFQRSASRDSFVLWANAVNTLAYMSLCASHEADDFTRKANKDDGADVGRRDVSGLDCTAWVYDLFRPDEDYAARGAHPSGVGVDRYIAYSDLSEAERDYLRLQRNLSLVNLIDPFLFGRDHFEAVNPIDGRTLRWNANARHYLAPFGYALAANLYLNGGDEGFLATAWAYVNDVHVLPGLELRWVEQPLTVAGRPLRLSARAALWSQPQDQLFRAREAHSGGLLGARVAFPVGRRWTLYAEAEAKSEGWVPGNASLDADSTLRAGVIARVF
jgi:hypothetical protein